MFTTPSTLLRRCSSPILAFALSSICLAGTLGAQAQSVVSSTVVAVPHNEIYGAPWQNQVSNRGDFVLLDFKSTGLYQYPGNGGPEVTIAAPGAIAGGFTDSGIAIDPRNNNLYVDNNFNGGLLMYPFDAKTGLWDLPSVTVASGLAGTLGGSCGNYFQSAGLAMNDNGVMAVSTENGCGVEIFTVPVDASGNFGTATPVVAGLTKRAKTIAIDDAGNIYWNEDAGGLAGAVYLPAGTTSLTSDSTAVRVDPMLGNVQGVSVDRAGNVYVADGSAGVYLIPSVAGVPATASAVLLTTAPANSNATLDQVHGILFVPTASFMGFSDLVKVYLGRAEFGAVAVGATSATALTVTYTFTSATTPGSFAVIEAGTAGDFAIAGGSCTAGTSYAAGSSCTVTLNLAPHTTGDVAGSLAMLDAKGNTLNSTLLHGVGTGSSIVMSPATESAIGAAFKSPSQVAVDAAGNVYVADSGLGKVLQYAKGASATATPVSIGTGLVAPTGVAVDGTGNVFIADSGKVLEIPYGSTGLNAAGQFTLKSGFGAGLQLAADSLGNVFVSDPANARVANLRMLTSGVAEVDATGFTQLQAIAADGVGDLFVANGQNLVKLSTLNIQTTILTTLPTTTNGLALDASGAVYVTSSNQTVRIPNEGGTLNSAHLVTLATGVTKPVSVAVDTLGNAYVLDGKALNIDYVNANGSLNLGTLTTTTATQTGSVTIFNDGNAPLTITGFSSSADFSVTSNTCVGTALAVGLSCNATVTFNPGPGDQGKLSALLLVQGKQANAPIGINVNGIGAALAGSTTALNVGKPSVTNAPVIVTVTPATGTTLVPTGNVTVTVTGTGLTPVVITQPLVNGTVTINETALPVGNLTFTALYSGDRVYGTSTATTSAVVSIGTVTLVQPAASTVPIYVLASGAGAQEPYDASQLPFYYNYPVTVKTANGAPLLGVPVFSGTTQTGTDYGIVTFVLSGTTTPACLGSSAIVNVSNTGLAPFGTQCFGINNSNNQVPNILTSYTFTPIYSGNTDPNYGTVTGTPVTVIALRNPSVLISAATPSMTVAAGSKVSTNLMVTSLLGYGVTGVNGNLNNYSLPVEMECDALPAHATCTFAYPTPDPSDPNSTAVTPTTPGQVVMTINTNVAVGTTASLQQQPGGYYAAVAGLGALGLAFRRRRSLRSSLLTVLAILGCSSIVLGMSACSSANISATPTLTTPKGTYTVAVTAKQTGSKQVPNPSGGAPITVYGNANQMSIPYTVSLTIQ